MTVSAGSTILAADLNGEVDDETSAIATHVASLYSNTQIDVFCTDLVTTTELPLRSRSFTPQDDYHLSSLRLMKRGGAAAITLTMTLTAESVGSDQSDYLYDRTYSLTLTTAGAGEEHQALDCTTEAYGITLFKGVKYTLTVSSDSATLIEHVQAIATLRSYVRPRPGKMVPNWLARTGAPMTPEYVNGVMENHDRVIQRLRAARLCRSMLVIPFDDVDNADASNEKIITVPIPNLDDYALSVEHLELYVAGVAATYTVTMTGNGNTVSIDATATGTAAYAEAEKACTERFASSTDMTFTITGTAGWDTSAACLIVHLVHDRNQNLNTSFTRDQYQSGPGANIQASSWTGAFSDYATEIAELATKRPLSLWVGILRNDASPFSALHQYRQLPALGRQLYEVSAYLLRATTADVRFRVFNHAGVAQYDQTVAAAGANTTAAEEHTLVESTQAADDPDDSNDDWELQIESTAGTSTIVRAYAVLAFI